MITQSSHDQVDATRVQMVPVVQQMGADCACHVNLNAQRSASLTDLSTGLATGAFNLPSKVAVGRAIIFALPCIFSI